MKHLRCILHRLVFVAFTEIGRIKPVYEIVGCILVYRYCCNFSAGVALNARFITNGMCAKNNTVYMWRKQGIIEWSPRVISVVARCHGAKLCAYAARAFRSQQYRTSEFPFPCMHWQRVLFGKAWLRDWFSTCLNLVTLLRCCSDLQTLTHFLCSIHEYFWMCENSKCLLWQLKTIFLWWHVLVCNAFYLC